VPGPYSNKPRHRLFGGSPLPSLEDSLPKRPAGGHRAATNEDPDRSRDHLANERTFLAWVRTGIAIVVFGFAIGRFAIVIREFEQSQGNPSRTPELSVWVGTAAIVAGVLLTLAGLVRYRRTRIQLESGKFEPAGFVIDLIGILTAVFGLLLAGYLIYIELRV
jgi:putative membrane protein